jgi:hypothetical protein|tara:strand:- start:255 stop:713 length:459 start_codon:yes stop_codon:yes gene_type:complete
MTKLTKGELICVINEKASIHKGLINAPDANYSLFSSNYVTGEGYDKFKEWLFRRGILGWRHTFDCDNYAEAFRVFLQIVHSKAQKGKTDNSRKQAVAVGVIWYERDGRGGHAINLIVTKDGENLVVKFVEPQDGNIIELSQTERESIFFVLI